MTSLLKDLRSDNGEESVFECRHGTSELASTGAYAPGSDRQPEPDGFEPGSDEFQMRPVKQVATGRDSAGADKNPSERAPGNDRRTGLVVRPNLEEIRNGDQVEYFQGRTVSVRRGHIFGFAIDCSRDRVA